MTTKDKPTSQPSDRSYIGLNAAELSVQMLRAGGGEVQVGVPGGASIDCT